MTEWPVTIAAEGILDLAVLRRLARDASLSPDKQYGAHGKAGINKRIVAYNAAARHAPWIVMRDLDRDAVCPGELVGRLLPSPAQLMVFRLAVREVEAWLMADTERFAAAFKVATGTISKLPEAVERPKAALLDIVAKSSNRDIRSAMVLRPAGGTLASGPEYNALLEAFVAGDWQPTAAAARAPSLAKARRRIQELAERVRLKSPNRSPRP
jgi:hypothetical protein